MVRDRNSLYNPPDNIVQIMIWIPTVYVFMPMIAVFGGKVSPIFGADPEFVVFWDEWISPIILVSSVILNFVFCFKINKSGGE